MQLGKLPGGLMDSIKASNAGGQQEAPPQTEQSTEQVSQGTEQQVSENNVDNSNTQAEQTDTGATEDAGLQDSNANNPSPTNGSEIADSSDGTSEGDDSDLSDGDYGLFGDNSTQTSAISETEVDYSEFGKAIGIEGKSRAEVLDEIKGLKSKYDAALEQQENFKFASPELEKANELAKMGGDYREYLGLTEVNYDNYRNEDLIAHSDLLVMPEFKDENGNPNTEAVNEYLKSLSPQQIAVRGNQIRNELKNHQEMEKARIMQEAQERKAKTDASLRNYLDNTKELYGLKLNAATRKEMYNAVTSEDFTKTLFFNKQGELDPERVIGLTFLAKYGGKILNVAKNKGNAEAHEQFYNEVSQPQTNTRKGNFVTPPDEKAVSPLDKLIRAKKDSFKK